MTLNTPVVIGAPVDVNDLYSFCRTLIDTPDHIQPYVSPGRIGNPPGIGLNAWLRIEYGTPQVKLDHTCTEDCDSEECESIRDDPRENGWGHVEVSFDTAYGYRGKGGETCSDLHARLVTALGRWLDARGLPWKWMNEYTGEWFDRYDQLATFGNAHRMTGADAWFRNTVVPAVLTAAYSQVTEAPENTV